MAVRCLPAWAGPVLRLGAIRLRHRAGIAREEAVNRYINEIIVHCSDTKFGQIVDGQEVNAATIRKWHTDPPPKGNGWRDIGYHYVILRDGTVEKGRPLDQIGAHVRGHNAHSVGICLVGGRGPDGGPEFNFTSEQARSLRSLIEEIMAGIGEKVAVSGHRDHNPKKACPCFNVRRWWETGRWEG